MGVPKTWLWETLVKIDWQCRCQREKALPLTQNTRRVAYCGISMPEIHAFPSVPSPFPTVDSIPMLQVVSGFRPLGLLSTFRKKESKPKAKRPSTLKSFLLWNSGLDMCSCMGGWHTPPVFRREAERLTVKLTRRRHGDWVFDGKGTALTWSFSKATL